MNDNFSYDDMLDILGEPQIYKNIKIYPLKILDIKEINLYSSILNINKNIYTEPLILSSSYLKFLTQIVPTMKIKSNHLSNIRMDYELLIRQFLSKITKYPINGIIIDRYYRKNKPKELINMKMKILLNYTIELSESDFESIRRIFLKQSGFEDSDFEIYDYKLQKYLDEALEFQMSQNKGATLNEQIVAYHVATGIPYSEIKKYTLKQFRESLSRANIFVEYKALRPLLASGQIEFKRGKLTHWLDHVESKGKYGSIIDKASNLKDKIGGVSSFEK